MADNLEAAGKAAQRLRWKLKFATGFVPEEQPIPKRFLEVVNWKGQTDAVYLEALRAAYIRALREMAGYEEQA